MNFDWFVILIVDFIYYFGEVNKQKNSLKLAGFELVICELKEDVFLSGSRLVK